MGRRLGRYLSSFVKRLSYSLTTLPGWACYIIWLRYTDSQALSCL